MHLIAAENSISVTSSTTSLKPKMIQSIKINEFSISLAHSWNLLHSDEAFSRVLLLLGHPGGLGLHPGRRQGQNKGGKGKRSREEKKQIAT